MFTAKAVPKTDIRLVTECKEKSITSSFYCNFAPPSSFRHFYAKDVPSNPLVERIESVYSAPIEDW